MNNFVRNNWLKIIIAVASLIAGISVGYYFVLYLQKFKESELLKTNEISDAFSYQQKCSEASKKFYDSNKPGIYDGYISHYNKSLNRCFLEFSEILF